MAFVKHLSGFKGFNVHLQNSFFGITPYFFCIQGFGCQGSRPDYKNHDKQDVRVSRERPLR